MYNVNECIKFQLHLCNYMHVQDNFVFLVWLTLQEQDKNIQGTPPPNNV